MRRAACWLALLVLWTADARAEPWDISAEAGVEIDSNVERSLSNTNDSRTTAAVSRVGGKLNKRDQVAGGTLTLGLSALTRLVHDDDLSGENVALLGGNVRWMRTVTDRPVSVGIAVSAVDAVPISESVGDRTFRYLAADALLVVRGGEGRALSLAAGGRAFDYKPDSAPDDDDTDNDYDWSGPAVSARLDVLLWQSASRTRSLALATAAGVELRAYPTLALAGVAPTDMTPIPSNLAHRDRAHRASIELTWTGSFVFAVGYQLQVVDSNSVFWSAMRNRATVLATIPLPHDLYATPSLSVQVDHYPDGRQTTLDPNGSQQITLDDENASSAQLRIGRVMSPTLSLEARAAIWRDLGDADRTFRRSLVYLGMIYAR
ncbi:MAG: hypothetical protein AB7P03_29415 [Kofleriaceae bacterium]